jgi:hypothetical protein
VNARSGRRRNFFNTAATATADVSNNTTASTAAVASPRTQQRQQQLSQTAPAAIARSGRHSSDRYASSDRYYHSTAAAAAQLMKPAAMHDSAYDEQFSDAYGEEYSVLQSVLAQRGRACAHRLRTHYCTAALRGALRGWRNVALTQRHCRYLKLLLFLVKLKQFKICTVELFELHQQ